MIIFIAFLQVALDIAYGAAAMATGGAPLPIGLAPVTITLILASLYSLMWYYVVLPFGTVKFANNPNNFDTSKEQEEFGSDALSFLEAIAKYHSYITGVLFAMLLGKKFLDVILKWNIFSTIVLSELPSAIKWMMGIYLAYKVVFGILSFIQPWIENVHMRYLFIDLLLSVIGFRENIIMLLMFVLNFFAMASFTLAHYWLIG